VPRDTTPTFELEMLVSGAVLFGLLQLAPVLRDLGERVEPHYGLLGIIAGAVVNLLAMASVYALTGCFMLHLLLRGWWVAMVGVHSVFPRGPRWERMKETGPITRGIYRARLRPLPHFITRTDNAASLVFATGFVLAASALGGAGVFVVGGLSVWAASAAGVRRPELVLYAVIIPLSALFLLVPLADYALGARLGARPSAMLRG
jgi:hypothetical protein